jgi:hypothetical protein
MMDEVVDWAAVNRNGHFGKWCIMVSGATYRVAGVYTDGRRVIVDDGLTFERAGRVRSLLIGASAFAYVSVESDQPSPIKAPPIGWPTGIYCELYSRNGARQ